MLNIITMPTRADRKTLLSKELQRQGISDYKLWAGVTDFATASENISVAHKRIVMYAKSRKLPYIIIAEDDVCFPAEDGYQYFLNNIPEKFDLYLGGVYRGITNFQKAGFSGLHLYAVSAEFYDRFILVNAEDGLDNGLSRLIKNGKCDAHLCFPMAAIQHETPSDNFVGTVVTNKYFFDKNNTYGYQGD